MNHSPRVTYLHYSKLPAIPLLGNFLYQIQGRLYESGKTNTIYMSRRKTSNQKKLLGKISRLATTLVITTHRFSELIKQLKCETVLDIPARNTKKWDEENLYGLMWSLVNSSSVTERTKKALKDFIPSNFPSKKTVVIPYNDSFEVVCDYIFQTAKVLANKGHIVYLVGFANPVSILKFIFKGEQKETGRRAFFEQNKIIIVNPLTLFPIRLQKLKILKSANRYLMLLYTALFVKRVDADLVWCFDPADSDIVRLTNKFTTTIYDCVDYFSTLDPEINKEIKDNEAKLIKEVDFFFVNSHALEKTKGKIRKPDAALVQGFDLEPFTSRKGLSPQEKKEIAWLKKMFSKISKPRVGFVGALTYRFDFKLVFSLIKKMPHLSFVFTDALLPMPYDDRLVGTHELIEKIRKSPNAHFVPKTYSRAVIRETLGNFDIGIIPYDTGFDFNRYSYPMKLFEYFYMGLPVISTPIEELKRFPKFVKLGKAPGEWEAIIKNLLSKPWPRAYKQMQRKLAEKNSWENKVDTILIKLRK